MQVLEWLGHRWTLRVLWELRDGEPATFRALQERCGGLSSSVLSTRLSELREAGIVELREPAGYALTARGRELLVLLGPLDDWANAR